MGVNVDVEYWPVGCSTPQILTYFICLSDLNFAHFFFKNQGKHEEKYLQGGRVIWN